MGCGQVCPRPIFATVTDLTNLMKPTLQHLIIPVLLAAAVAWSAGCATATDAGTSGQEAKANQAKDAAVASWNATLAPVNEPLMKIGERYYQEQAPGVALDRGENVATNATITTPAGLFNACLKVRETTPLESGAEYKLYAPGIGLVQDGNLKLVKYSFPRK
jgi:hypothetical protein